MIDLLAPVAFVLALLRGEVLPPKPACGKPRPCAVWTGRRYDCMRRHTDGPCEREGRNEGGASGTATSSGGGGRRARSR